MKLRVATYGMEAEHELLTALPSLLDHRRSISDFDALVVNPSAVIKEFNALSYENTSRWATMEDDTGETRASVSRIKDEVLDLLQKKGGVVLVVLTDNDFELRMRCSAQRSQVTISENLLFFLERALAWVRKTSVLEQIRAGLGTNISFAQNETLSYLRIMKASLHFHAVIANAEPDDLEHVFATDSVGHIVSAELKVGDGSLLFVPATNSNDKKRLGAALLETIRSRLRVDEPEVEPAWVQAHNVPGQETHDAELMVLSNEVRRLEQRSNDLKAAKKVLLDHRRLLYTTGKHVLEPAVRNAFRVLGFDVSDPDTYDGEWDLEMSSPEGMLCIGEVEGPEGAVDVDKLRQTIDYHTSQTLAGFDNKALLIGNAYRSTPVAERAVAFTEHAIRGAEKMGIALVPTPDLFRAVCVALEAPEQAEAIRVSITSCSGVWRWPPA